MIKIDLGGFNMKNLLRVIAIFFIGSIFIGSNFAFAADTSCEQVSIDVDEEYIRAYNNITDIPVTDDMKALFSFTATSSEGESIPADTYYTVRKLSETNEKTLYALTAVSEVKREPGVSVTTRENINVRLSVTLEWYDHLGLENEFKSISGTWSCFDGCYVTDRKVGCDSTDLIFQILGSQAYYPTSNAFTYYPALAGHRLRANVSSRAYSADGSNWQSLSVFVESKYTT